MRQIIPQNPSSKIKILHFDETLTFETKDDELFSESVLSEDVNGPTFMDKEDYTAINDA